MSNVFSVLPGAMTGAQVRATTLLAHQIAKAINDAKDAGVPQGFIVSTVHAIALSETQELLK